MKVFFNNSCKICRSEINLYKKENIKDIDWIDITNNSDAEKETSRNDKELFNLQCWAKTCESFFTPDEWIWIFKEFGYSGEYEFIYFE